MSMSDRKEPDIKPDYELAIKERIAAEEKVAQGVSRLYEYCRSKKNPKPDDEQKIATVTISPEEAEIAGFSEFFPNKLCNGITVHFYEPGYTRHPPLRYMVSQKIKSLCDAAKTVYKVDELKNIEAKVEEIIKAEYKNYEAKADQKWEKFKKDKKYSKLSAKEKELEHQKIKDKQFNKMTDYAMNLCSGTALDMLHKAYGPKKIKIDREEFSKAVIKESTHHRSNNRDTLTFNEETSAFSYDGLAYFSRSGNTVKSMEPVTAHDKRLGKRCANLSMVFEGNLGENTDLNRERRELGYKPDAIVTSSLVKHSSLAPDSDLKHFDTFTSSQKKLEILMQTANNAEDVLLAQINLRRHGQDEKHASKSMHIDWNYELLTTNAFNNEKEATNFGYAAQATGLMSGGTYQVGDVEVKADITLANVGINKYAGITFQPNKGDLQPNQNRKSLIHQTEVLRKMDFSTAPLEVQKLKTLLAPEVVSPKYQKLLDEYELIKKVLAGNADAFNQVRKDYNEKYKEILTDIPYAESMIKFYKQQHLVTNDINAILWQKKLTALKKDKSNIEDRSTACVKVFKKQNDKLSAVAKKNGRSPKATMEK